MLGREAIGAIDGLVGRSPPLEECREAKRTECAALSAAYINIDAMENGAGEGTRIRVHRCRSRAA